MAQYSCPECRVPFSYDPQHNINSQSQNNNISIADEGDNEAEDILRNWLKWIRTLIIVISVLTGVVAFVASAAMGGAMFILGIVVAAIVIVLGWCIASLAWAMGMVFVNISTNVRLIKKSMK